MLKHEVYKNQESFVPKIAVSADVSALSGSFVALIVEGETALPQYLQTAYKNKQLQEDLKKGSAVVYGREGDSFEKVVLLSVSKVDAKEGYQAGTKHLAIIQGAFQGAENLSFNFSDSITQAYLNEYVYGLLNANYKWQLKSQSYKKENTSIFKPIRGFNFVSTVLKQDDATFAYITQVVGYKLYFKELIQTRANIANTYWMRDQAKAIQAANADKVDIEIIQGNELLDKGLNLMHAVGRASASEPILAILNYKGDPENADKKYSVVGKGVVYDCGGLNIKMAMTEAMHGDKGGACACLSIFKAVVELKLKVNLVCSVALVENFISDNSYRPSDIIETKKGITVEVLNTDAEGRNILADALSYTQLNYKPHTVFDFATLTGACLVSLGLDTAAIFSNNEDLSAEIVALSKPAYEPLHPLPITNWMRENIVSEQGDIRNLGKQPWGGSGTAAAYLEKFIEEGVKWAHFDIAQACSNPDTTAVRVIVDYLRKQL